MGQRLTALVMTCVAAFSIPAWGAKQAPREGPAAVVLRAFVGHADQSIDAFLMTLRPVPLDTKSRARVLASLPPGDLKPSPNQVKKMVAVQRILDYSARSGVVSVKVIDLDFAFVGLYLRTVILVSSRALELLDADEFGALMAHELGHDYDAADYAMAIQQHDAPRMRELELRADAIAVLTLERVGIDPERLVSAVTRQTHYNEMLDSQRPNATQTTADRYVSLSERVTFIRTVMGLRWADNSAGDAVIAQPLARWMLAIASAAIF